MDCAARCLGRTSIERSLAMSGSVAFFAALRPEIHYTIAKPLSLTREQKRAMTEPGSTSISVGTKVDSLGMGLSLLCMIHCLAFPILASFAPAFMKALPGDDTTHRFLAVGVGLAGALAFRSGYRFHRRGWVLGLFLLGLALISVPALVGETVLSVFGETAITIGGSCLLITAHWINRSFCRSCVVRGCADTHLKRSH